jgi:hypothetical protein
MSEFIREVDDEYRRDRVLAFWTRYGLVIGLIALICLAGWGGWRYLAYREHQTLLSQTQKMEEPLAFSREAKPEETIRVLSELEGEATGPVKGMALLRRAGELAKTNGEEAAKAFDEAARETTLSLTLRQWAQLRASALRLDGEASAAALQVLETLATPTHPWRHQARELLGVAALKRGDMKEASRWLNAITVDRQTPPSLKGRMEVYAALLVP